MTEETKNPLDPYTKVASEIIGTVARRADIDGDPQAHAEVFARLLATYMAHVGRTRPFGPADAFVIQVLDAVALIVSGGVQAQRFRDMAKAAIAGSVHVEEAYERMAAAKRAEDAKGGSADPEAAPAMPAVQDGPLAPSDEPAAPSDEPLVLDEAALFPVVGTPGRRVVSSDNRLLGRFNAKGAFVKEDAFTDGPGEPEALPADNPHPLDESPDEPAGTIGDAADAADHALVADADLHRWILDEGSDPWSDLLEEPEDPAKPDVRYRREGVEQAQVQARFDRIHAFLDVSSNCPAGVTKAQWKAAKGRSLPVLYGDA